MQDIQTMAKAIVFEKDKGKEKGIETKKTRIPFLCLSAF